MNKQDTKIWVKKVWGFLFLALFLLPILPNVIRETFRDPARWDGITFDSAFSVSPQLNWVTYKKQDNMWLAPLPNGEDRVEIMKDFLASQKYWGRDEWMPNGTGSLVLSHEDSENTLTWWLTKVNAPDNPLPLCTLPRSRNGVGSDRTVIWSPDSTAFALIGMGDEMIVRADGSGCEELPDSGLSSDLSWSPDSQSIAYYHSWPSDLSGTQILNLRTYKTATVYPAIGAPIWFPDGDRIALRSLIFDEEEYAPPRNGKNILVIRADGSGLIKDIELPDGYSIADAWQGYSWSPDGSHLAIPLDGFFSMAIGILDSDDLTLSILKTREFRKILGWTPDESAIVVSELYGFSVRVFGFSLVDRDYILTEIPVTP